jgi:hypothetical protein
MHQPVSQSAQSTSSSCAHATPHSTRSHSSIVQTLKSSHAKRVPQYVVVQVGSSQMHAPGLQAFIPAQQSSSSHETPHTGQQSPLGKRHLSHSPHLAGWVQIPPAQTSVVQGLPSSGHGPSRFSWWQVNELPLPEHVLVVQGLPSSHADPDTHSLSPSGPRLQLSMVQGLPSSVQRSSC